MVVGKAVSTDRVRIARHAAHSTIALTNMTIRKPRRQSRLRLTLRRFGRVKKGSSHDRLKRFAEGSHAKTPRKRQQESGFWQAKGKDKGQTLRHRTHHDGRAIQARRVAWTRKSLRFVAAPSTPMLTGGSQRPRFSTTLLNDAASADHLPSSTSALS